MKLLDRWKAAEPVRLYLYGVASAILAAAVVIGWLTETAALALGGVVTAVLLAPAVEAARARAWSPKSVDELTTPPPRVPPTYLRTDDGRVDEPFDLGERYDDGPPYA